MRVVLHLPLDSESGTVLLGSMFAKMLCQIEPMSIASAMGLCTYISKIDKKMQLYSDACH
jgi:hypothetical protein